jgi:DNA polymerase I-like protein with 3'-5' exonuclease and polymerase domains
MLQYLQDQIPTPDLIILDENLKAGLLLEDACTELQIKSVLKVVDGTDAVIIRHLLNIIQQISTKLVDTGGHPMIINGRKLTEAGNQETTIIELLAERMNTTDEDVMASLASLSKSLDNLSRIHLCEQEIDMNAIGWIKGLTSPSTLSFVHIAKNGDVRYSTKRITPIGFHDTPIKILDATGDASAYGALLNRNLKTVRADVDWNSNRVHIKKSLRRTDMSKSKKPVLKSLLADMLDCTKAPRIMVITYMRHEKQIVDILKEIDPARKVMGHHFFGPRGINSYEECDAVLVIGLPYPNLNSAAQDACILFPNAKDSDKRMEWTEACMQWELVQSIHRIRPVNKSGVDIILAANRWPSILPEPQIVIDKSQTANWKEITVQRLQPFVEEFGFLNQDIGFLANVYVKTKSRIAKQFQGNMTRLIHEAACLIPELKGKFITGQLGCKEEFGSSGYTCFNDDDVLPTDEKIKLIKALKYIKAKIHLRSKSQYVRLVNLIQKQSVVWTNGDIILSNTKQWSVLLNHFKDQYSHFEKFKIKLPHARGNAVDGVGNPDRVGDFYGHINNLGVVGKIDIDSCRPTEACLEPVRPISAGLVSIYIPDDEDMAFVGWGSEFRSISLNQEPEELRTCFEGVITGSDIKIITNNGKQVAMAFLSCGLPKCEIIDVVIAEKLIANGEVEYRALSLKTIFKRHGLPEGLERSGIVHRLVDVCANQEQLIQSGGLESVFDLESKVIWITAKIEAAGIGIDAEGLLRYYDHLNAKLESLAASLEKTIPAGISLNDREKIKEHLNSAYALSLAKIDEDSIKFIANTSVRALCCNLLEYWKTERERRDVEFYISITGCDDRVHDSIDQLNAKTGRFYRPLQTVQKDGLMRSLFRAKKGYKFIVADYSQQEARIIAGLCNDAAAIALFTSGKDIYLETAKSIVGGRLETSRLRALGKEIVLGLNNGRSAYSISDSLTRLGFGYDVDDVHGMILRYNMKFSGMKEWRDGIESSALNDGFVSTPLGRRLKVDKDTNHNSLINYPVQGTAADGFKMALIQLDDEMADQDAQLVHILHDEVIIEAREDIADTVLVVVRDCMERAFKRMIPDVPMVVKPVVNNSWG